MLKIFNQVNELKDCNYIILKALLSSFFYYKYLSIIYWCEFSSLIITKQIGITLVQDKMLTTLSLGKLKRNKLLNNKNGIYL